MQYFQIFVLTRGSILYFITPALLSDNAHMCKYNNFIKHVSIWKNIYLSSIVEC